MRIGISYKTLAQLRAFTAEDVRKNNTIYLTDEGKEGEFIYDSSDTTSADNIGTILVTTTGGFRFKRKYKANVYASWFINESDTTGTSGNRERNAIFRAYTYVAAQTKPQAVILDNSRIWYVNNDAIYLNIATGKKITIKGEGNPVIDFLCTGAGDDSNDEAVFRTSNSWTYAGVGDVTFTGSISGTTLTVTAIGANPFKIGQLIYESTILYGTYITGFKTGTGGTGTYTISKTQTLSSTAGLGAKAGVLGWSNGNRTINYGKIEIKGITFDGNRNPANAGSATVFSRPLLFRQCEEVNILNNHFQNIPGSALAIGGTDAVNVSDNSFKSVFARETTNDAIGDAISIYAYCQNARITNNDIKLSSGQSGRCGISVDDFCRNSVVTNNTIVGYERAIHIEACLGVQTIGNTIRRSPIGIISGINKDCSFIGNFIDGALFVANSTLAANALLFAYNDENSLFEGNTILGYKLKGESDYLAKFWGSGLIVKNNKFINVFDSSNQTLSINSLTIANSVSKTFTYATAPDLIWEVGERIRASKDYFYYMEGVITAVSSTSVTITVDAIGGSGTFDSWTLRYAAKGNVHGAGYNDDNEYEGNIFDFSNLEVSDNKNVIVRLNTLKSSYIIAQNTTNADINNNKHIPSFGEVYSRGINAYGSIKSIITENTFTNPVEYVVDNGTSTGLVCQDNVYIRTDASAAGNGYWYVNSTLADTNINRTVKPNIIRDFVNTQNWIVGNTGVAYLITSVNIKTYNVRGDGVTNDTTNLQAAFASNKDVYVPKGTYLVNGEIEITGNVYCEHGAVFKVVDSYSGSLFNIKSKKHLHIKNLYIDATGATNNPLTGTPSITCIGLKIQGLWLSTIENFSMVFHSTSTSSSNIGIQMISSESTLGFGCYGVRIVNPYISRGGWGITTNKQTSETDAFITHLEITSGWIGSQEIGSVYLNYAYNCNLTNIGTDVIKLDTGIGYKIENSSQIVLNLGEYNIIPSTPDTAKIVSIDDATCSFIDISAPRGIIASTIGGTEYSMRTAGALRLKPTTADGVYTEMRSDNAYGQSFVIEGNYDGDTTLRKILQYNTFDGLRTENVPLVTTTGVQVLTNKNYNKVSITEPATLATLSLADGSTLGLVGAFITTLNSTANTSVTLPISGTLATLANSEALTNKSVNGVTLVTGGSASLFLNQQGNYVSASGGGGGDALTTNPLSQFAATTSLQLKNTISDETGSGNLVFATSPTLVTPVLGVASATSINGLTITSSTGALTITNAKTLSVSNTLTFTGTDSSSVAFGAGGTVAYTNVTTLSSLVSIGTISTGTWNASIISSTYGGTGVNNGGRTLTLNTNSGTLAFSNASKTFTIANSITISGTDSTTLTFQGTDTYVGRTTTDTLTNKRITARVQSTTSTATLTFAADSDDIAILTAQAAALTIAAPSGTPTQGQPIVFRIKDNGTARAITWNAIFRAIGITLPTTTVINKTMYVSGYYSTTDTKWDMVGYAIEA